MPGLLIKSITEEPVTEDCTRASTGHLAEANSHRLEHTVGVNVHCRVCQTCGRVARRLSVPLQLRPSARSVGFEVIVACCAAVAAYAGAGA